MKKIIALSLLLIISCSKDSENEQLFSDKVRGKKYTRVDLIQKFNNGTIDYIGVFYKFSKEKGNEYMGYSSATNTCYKTTYYSSFTFTNETANTLEGVGQLRFNRGTEIFKATTNNDGSEITLMDGQKFVVYEDYYDMLNIHISFASDNSCSNLGF